MKIVLYLGFVIVGSILAAWYGAKTKKFVWREYWLLLAAPLLGVLGLSFSLGVKVIYIFIFGMFFLPCLEWGSGYFYHKTLGSRLWIYSRYPLPGRYTSFLTLPIWGCGIVLLWMILQKFF